MKKLVFAIITLLWIGAISAKQVKPEDIKRVAESFVSKTGAFIGQNHEITLAKIFASETSSGNTQSYFYIFNIDQNKGYVIISADDVAWPVLGYSTEGIADPNNIPWSIAKWLEGYRSDIQFAIENSTAQSEMCKLEWEKYLKSGIPTIHRRAGSVSPLLSTKWNQSPNYNALCPYDNSSAQRTVVGCVATAMAQVIKYHNYPTQGTGYHSYNHSKYGTLSANFASTTYDYTSMPNTLSGSNSAIATLSYHCGVGVDMNYGVASSGGSGAYVISDQSPVTHCAEYALETYFGYKTSLEGVQRVNYTTSSWKTLLKNELDASRPILYAGFGNGGGHCFVLDGYDNSDYFHINWGWGGSYDGYFSIDALNPSGVGTGGGSGGFNSGHQAVIGVEPPSGGGNPGKFDLVLYKELSLSASTIGYGAPFSITTNIYNKGTAKFTGDYGMAVFDNNSNFVDFVETKTGYSLTNGNVYNTDLEFSTTGNVKFLPGNYTAILYYRPTSGDWSAVGNYSGNYNYASFSVEYSNDVELYKSITISTGSTTITRNQNVTVSLDIANYSNYTISGTIDVSLYNLEGEYVESINAQAFSLNSLTHYANGLTFNLSTGVVADPGSYLLAVLYKPTGGSWTLVGSTTYQNPIVVTVQDTPINPDIYENNNAVNTSYTLGTNFSGNTTKVVTTGSNFHTGTDYDYYKIVLPSGYDYSIAARVHDANSSGNGNVYTVDAVLSVSSDGSIFSEAYDVSMPSNLQIKDGGTFYVKISPYFTGNIGTYLLDVTINRTPIATGVSGISQTAIKIFPNPAIAEFHVEAQSAVQKVTLTGLDGKEIATYKYTGTENNITISTLGIAPGNYFLQVVSRDKTAVLPVVILR